MSLYVALTIASLKMYFRDRQALFWTIFFPLLIMLMLGSFRFGGFNPPDVGVHDAAQNEASARFIEALRGKEDVPMLDLSFGTNEEVSQQLELGETVAVIVIPENFGVPGGFAEIQVTYDERYLQARSIVATILEQTTTSFFREFAQVPAEYRVENTIGISESMTKGLGQGYSAWLIPGIAAMAIMQTGLFGVLFTLIRFKSQGVLRRLKATPIGASHFLTGQLITRLLVVLMQTYILVVVGSLILGVDIGGDRLMAWFDMLVFALLGGALFIAFGLAISGWAKTEESAAPMAQVISLPMMMLSGVFFPITVLPGWIYIWAQHLPLAYLVEGLRAVTFSGTPITSLGSELLGLIAWLIVLFILATRTFKWE
ncbi:MAG: ABC transporter permease [Pseudomonadota bacterium]